MEAERPNVTITIVCHQERQLNEVIKRPSPVAGLQLCDVDWQSTVKLGLKKNHTQQASSRHLKLIIALSKESLLLSRPRSFQ